MNLPSAARKPTHPDLILGICCLSLLLMDIAELEARLSVGVQVENG